MNIVRSNVLKWVLQKAQVKRLLDMLGLHFEFRMVDTEGKEQVLLGGTIRTFTIDSSTDTVAFRVEVDDFYLGTCRQANRVVRMEPVANRTAPWILHLVTAAHLCEASRHPRTISGVVVFSTKRLHREENKKRRRQQ